MLYTLKNDALTMTVDSLGAQLVSLKGSDGFEYIWTGDPEYWDGHAPVLFPIVGALRKGKAVLFGKEMEMRQHGFARNMEFSRLEDENSLSFALHANAETMKNYPFDFELRVRYTLCGMGYKTEMTVKNNGGGAMPFVIGGHPGFNIPISEKADFTDYTIVFEKDENQKCPAVVVDEALIDPFNTAFELNGREIALRHSLFYNDALVFENLNSERVRILNKASGRGVEMDFSGFTMLGIWSAQNDGPYVCLEPWTGCAARTDEGDEFEKKKGMCFLSGGEEKTFSFTVKFS